MLRITKNEEAMVHATLEVQLLTERAVNSTYLAEDLTEEQVHAIMEIPKLSGRVYCEAAMQEHQHLVAATTPDGLAGFVIATRHDARNLELDWLMVDPGLHGTGLARTLMTEGLAWLGPEEPIWLTVVKHNPRAIRFYRKFGFEIDARTDLNRIVPNWVMRRPAALQGTAAPLSRSQDGAP